MSNKDPNYVAKIEQAISKKYGEETIQNPKSRWTDEKEREYVSQLKDLYKQRDQLESEEEEIGGVFINKKLLNKESSRSCPVCSTYSLNTKNRDATIKKYNYGPLNVDEPADYWEKIAKYWKTTEEAARKSLCGNCVAFDISPRMKECMPGDTFDDDGELGYCWMHHFKCHSARACHTWAKGGPIKSNKESAEWQKKNSGGMDE